MGTEASKILHLSRPPVGPEGNAEHHSNFHAPEGHRRTKGMTPVNGGSRGGGEYGREASILSRPPGAFLVSFWASKKKLAACRRRNFPAKKGKTARRVVAQASFSCPYGAIHLLAPYRRRMT